MAFGEVGQAEFIRDSSGAITGMRIGAVTINLTGGGGGGGSSTYAGLTDAASVDLTTINTALSNALSTLSSAVSALTSSVSGKVAKGGDTMTGPLVLAADPTAALQPATKQYVDAGSVLTPIPVSADRVLTTADAQAPLICTSSPVLTVPLGFMRRVEAKGTMTFAAASGVTVNEARTSGAANPWCTLVPTATNVYDMVGGKP